MSSVRVKKNTSNKIAMIIVLQILNQYSLDDKIGHKNHVSTDNFSKIVLFVVLYKKKIQMPIITGRYAANFTNAYFLQY